MAHFKITYHSSQIFVSILPYSITGTFQGTFQSWSGGYNHISELLMYILTHLITNVAINAYFTALEN